MKRITPLLLLFCATTMAHAEVSQAERDATAHFNATRLDAEQTVRRDAILAFIAVQPQSPDAQVAIVRGLLDHNPLVRNAAIETLSKIQITAPGIVAMVAHLATHEHLGVRRSAILALGSMNGPTSAIRSLTLLRATRDADAEIRESAALGLQLLSTRHCESFALGK